jgi:hypothetical protein
LGKRRKLRKHTRLFFKKDNNLVEPGSDCGGGTGNYLPRLREEHFLSGLERCCKQHQHQHHVNANKADLVDLIFVGGSKEEPRDAANDVAFLSPFIVKVGLRPRKI